MITGIVTPYQAWFCNHCKQTSHVLYIMGNKQFYCHRCVPDEVKASTQYMNQNREPVEYKEQGEGI